MKKFLLYFLLCTIAIPASPALVYAQAEKGMALLDKGNPADAQVAFRMDIHNPKTGPLALYGLSRVFADARYEHRQLDTAFAYIEICDRAYRKMPPDLKGKIVKKLTTAMIAEQRKNIVDLAAIRAKEQGTTEAYDFFLEYFPKPAAKTKRTVLAERNALALQSAQAGNNWRDVQAILDRYGESFAANTPLLYQEAQISLFKFYTRENGLNAYPTFRKLFPDNIASKDTLQTAFFRALDHTGISALEHFVEKYPDAIFKTFAVDTIAARISSAGTEAECRKFISSYPDHPRTQAVWQHLYAGILEKAASPARLEQFLLDHPKYPFPEQVATDMAYLQQNQERLQYESFSKQPDPAQGLLFLERYPESSFKADVQNRIIQVLLQKEARTAGTGQFIQGFLKQFPDHPQASALWKHFYDGVREGATDPARLERFLQDNPQYPFPEQAAKDIAYLEQNREKLEYEAFVMKPDVKTGFEFLRRFPNSTHGGKVKQRMTDLLLLPDFRTPDIERFLREFPSAERRQSLLKQLYDRTSQNLDLESIRTFELSYPDFGDKDRIAADRQRAILAGKEPGTYSEEKRAMFEEYIRIAAPSDKAMAALRQMINTDFRNGNYAAAAAVVNSFSQNFDNNNLNYNRLKNLLSLSAQDVNRQNFAPAINTPKDDYAPILSADGRTLYLCRLHEGSEDIFVSQQNGQSIWSAPKAVAEWNTSDNSEAPESISADGNEFYLFKRGKFYLSRKTATGWSAPQQLGPPLNSFNWQADLSISADGKAILFAAKGLMAQPDIYASLLQENGAWGEPFALGATINTSKSDRSPFIHPDGKTLYFSSEGHFGFGISDIFMSKRLDDTWTRWSEPVNLGPAINTPGNDWGFRVSTDGKFAYYSASIGGNSDIVRCELPQTVRPEQVGTITGRMTDTEGKPLDAEILWEDLKTGEVVQVTRTNPSTGEFFAVLPDRSRYGYSVRKPGYFPLAGNVDLRGNLGEIRLDKPMELATLEEMKSRDLSLPLNNLFFETAKYELQPESFPELNRLAQLVISEQLRVEIQGHTDNVGADASNQTLSENRAKSVRDYLIGQGCDSTRIEAKGFGKTRPKASNDNDAGRALNRRVEIRIKS